MSMNEKQEVAGQNQSQCKKIHDAFKIKRKRKESRLSMLLLVVHSR